LAGEGRHLRDGAGGAEHPIGKTGPQLTGGVGVELAPGRVLRAAGDAERPVGETGAELDGGVGLEVTPSLVFSFLGRVGSVREGARGRGEGEPSRQPP
jgi:hypothetical protein